MTIREEIREGFEEYRDTFGIYPSRLHLNPQAYAEFCGDQNLTFHTLYAGMQVEEVPRQIPRVHVCNHAGEGVKPKEWK